MFWSRIATAAFALTLAGATPSQEAENDLCTDVNELNESVLEMHGLPPNATAEDAARVNQRAEKAALELEGSLQRARPEEYRAFDEARVKLETAIRALPADASESEARSQLADEETAVRNAAEKMFESIDCPE
jgi:hypothetical protein